LLQFQSNITFETFEDNTYLQGQFTMEPSSLFLVGEYAIIRYVAALLWLGAV
jgi:hypothetical protein